MQQSCADLASDGEGSGLSGALFAAACGMQFVLPNRTTLRATREGGLVQIALALVIRAEAASFGIGCENACSC